MTSGDLTLLKKASRQEEQLKANTPTALDGDQMMAKRAYVKKKQCTWKCMYLFQMKTLAVTWL